MNQNKLLKIYLIAAAVSVVMFVVVFNIGVNSFSGMGAVYAATLPFLLSALGLLAAFGLGLAPTGEAPCRAHRDNVVYLKAEAEDREPCCYELRRIS